MWGGGKGGGGEQERVCVMWIRYVKVDRDGGSYQKNSIINGVRCSSVVRVFAHGVIDPSWSGPIELFLIPASAP